MDKKLIYFLLGFAVFYFLYYRFVLAPMELKKPPASKAPVVQTTPPASQVKPQSAPAVTPAEITTHPATAQVPTMTTVVETPLYRAELLNKGAVISSFRLKKYKDDFGQPLEMVAQRSRYYPLQLDLEDKNLSKIANESSYTVSQGSFNLKNQEAGDLDFTYSDGDHTFRKQFRFHGESYLIDCSMVVTNKDQAVPLKIIWAPGIESVQSYKKENHLKPSRALVNTGDGVEHLDAKKGKEYKKIGSTVRWAGVENNYFLAIFIPNQDHHADAYMNQIADLKPEQQVNVTLEPSKAEEFRMSLFIGPKDFLLLRQMGMDLQDAVNFGFFGPIAKGLFFALRYFHNFTNNYGWAIVLLTILVKIVFTPFTQMSFASMKKMQLMQPELKKVQEKYGKMKNDDPRKQNMNVEIMGLHKRYGVNPLGGCLPMLLQMPVLFAFYQLLSNAIELRGAPFALWLQDLSQPDPWKITPLLMGGTMLLQQRMTPASDPTQQMMMYVMPVMFTFMSFNFPSGLVLYWFLSNILAIAHQFYFQRQQKIAVK